MALSSSTTISHKFSFTTKSPISVTKSHKNTRISSCKKSSEEANDHRSYSRGRRSHLVDENLIVLRQRIHEMKMVERNYEPPEEWMEWEKRYYASYDSYICEAMGLLQAQLMNTRPSLALGIMALIAVSVPTSTAMVVSRLVDVITSVLAAIHL